MNSEAILPQTTPAVAMIRTLGLIAAICGLIIVSAYQGTYDAVQENKRIAANAMMEAKVPILVITHDDAEAELFGDYCELVID